MSSPVKKHAPSHAQFQAKFLRSLDIPWLPMAALIIGLFLFYVKYLTNTLTFTGDGARILYYTDFIDNSREFFPLWNPYKVLGTPVMADPERFALIGYLFDFNDPYFFLKLNIFGLMMVALFAAGLYSFYRACSLSKMSSAAATFMMSTSGLFGILMFLGRFYVIANIALTLFAVATIIKKNGKPTAHENMLIAAIVGFNVAIVGYYALILPLAFVFVAMLVCRLKYDTFKQALILSLRATVLYTFTGITLFACLVLPLFFYNLDALSLPAEGGIGQALSLPASAMNMFFPLETISFDFIKGRIFPYISIILLPGLVLFIASVKKDMPDIWKALAILSLAPLGLLLAGITPMVWFIDLYEKTPILSHIRQTGSFQFLFAIAAMGLALMGFERVQATRKDIALGALGIFLVFAMLVVFSDRGENFVWKNGIWIIFYTAITAAIVFLFQRYKQHAKALPIFLILCCTAHIVLADHIALQPHIKRPTRAETKIILPREVSTLPIISTSAFDTTKDGYFRIYCDHPMKCPPLGAGSIQATQGFSLFFSREAANALNAFSKDDIPRQRPHWIKYKNCAELDSVWLEILNIRYLLCTEEKISHLPVTRHGEWQDSHIYQIKNWRPSIRFFYNWAEQENPSRDDIRKNWQKGIALIDNIDKLPNMEQSPPSKNNILLRPLSFYEGKIEVEIDAPANGILYLPEIYSKDWKVLVNDQKRTALKLFGSFRGVALEKGQHRVTFIYRPTIVYISFTISLLSLTGFCIYGLLHRRKKNGQ